MATHTIEDIMRALKAFENAKTMVPMLARLTERREESSDTPSPSPTTETLSRSNAAELSEPAAAA
jgi:hypothetical protein